ncbi:hypothetical protein I2486_11260 [Cellulophaga sp. E16_2]|uniref:Transcription regulator BetR N-terminal domain-containing protein n=1 Tax=Cellulophaga algicola (strain DSM 14237 / IC166 / ACAM 630) TaxID=688270 RepID=E6X5Y9_CELAD|nr:MULTISPECIES: hypothetical protein [Cellulophaga]ADV49531.1 hypothetical protein Celal_2237 [Cellulophaga algicola DSM 14237]MBO0591984.1 hypothetical protein [Cellulophaga sp. E16_2]
MFQKELLNHVQEILPPNESLIESIATALEISYDAAHRRTSLKSKFSLDETIILAKYFNLSLDRLFGSGTSNFVVVEKTNGINKEEELQQYFEDSYTSLIPLLKKKDCRILYSAKDIPIFYNLSNDELSHFKLFVWLKLLDKTFNNKAFEEFSPTLSLIQAGTKLGSLYNDLNITEIWDITTINSTLKQIHYYHKAGIITTESGLILCEQLKKLIQKIAEKINSTTTNFMFYYNELHLMNNTILVTAPNLKSLYVPFTLLSYYKTNDRHTCDQAEAFMMRQLQMSKLLNSTGEKERNIFFNKLYEKIDALKNLIKATQLLDFE